MLRMFDRLLEYLEDRENPQVIKQLTADDAKRIRDRIMNAKFVFVIKIDDDSYIEYCNGDKYEGDDKGGSRHGFGMYRYGNGLAYIGFWADDCKTNGQMHYIDPEANKIDKPNDEKYRVYGYAFVGNWIDGIGTGICYYSNGVIYEGEWKHNKPYGKGHFRSSL